MTQFSLEHQLIRTVTPVERRPAGIRWLAYPRHYFLVLILAIFDIVVTTLVLGTGGNELNAIARWAIESAGIGGMIAIKVSTLSIVLMICEYLGRHHHRAGRRVAEFALIANSAAVACGLLYLTHFSIVLLQWM